MSLFACLQWRDLGTDMYRLDRESDVRPCIIGIVQKIPGHHVLGVEKNSGVLYELSTRYADGFVGMAFPTKEAPSALNFLTCPKQCVDHVKALWYSL
jgi:hypothetical protein